MRHTTWILALLATLNEVHGQGVQPGAAYVFPAGGQRGSRVSVEIGGYNLTASTQMRFSGSGVALVDELQPSRTPPPPEPLLRGQDTVRAFNYPRELTGAIVIDGDAPPGPRWWQVWTAHGGSSARPFIVGEFPEYVERLGDDKPPRRVALPITANGRILLAEEIDQYLFHADAGMTVDCRVVAGEIGSTLDARAQVLDPTGREVASAEDTRGLDPVVRFTAAASGDYAVRVHDYAYTGSASHIYRLTIRTVDATDTAPAAKAPLAVSRDSTHDIEPNDADPQPLGPLPARVAGRLSRGDVDGFRFAAKKGERLAIAVAAAQLGSAIESLLVLRDAAGNELVRNDDSAGTTDSQLEFIPPSDGDYSVFVSDLSKSADSDVYELSVLVAEPDFTLRVAVDHVDVTAGATAALPISVMRRGGFDGEIELAVTGLGRGLSADSLKVAPKAANHSIQLNAQADAERTASPIRITGTARIGNRVVTRPLMLATSPPSDFDTILATVTTAAPFKVNADDTYFFTCRGTTHAAKIRIDRDAGFTGAVTLTLADMQIRYLQGVSGPTLVVPPGVNEVDYPLTIPETTELNRTCRVLVAGTAEIPGSGGRRQHVIAVSPKQCVMRMEPAVLSLAATPNYVETAAGAELVITLTARRALSFAAPVRIELVETPGVHGVAAEPIDLRADESQATVRLRLAPDVDLAGQPGVRFRATAQRNGLPVVAEAAIELFIRN